MVVVVARADIPGSTIAIWKASPKLKGMALIPLQDVSEAVTELLLSPKSGMALGCRHHRDWHCITPPPHRSAWCCLRRKSSVVPWAYMAVPITVWVSIPSKSFVPIHGLGHPFQLMIAFTGMVYHGVFDQFPTLRVGFMEARLGEARFLG